MKYEKLFEKGKIGRLELRNRVVMTAMGVMLGDWNGCATPEYARFYEERAKGGCGLIIPEFTSVDPDSGHCNRIQLGIYDARQIRSMEDICDAVHRHGAKIFVQLHHGGREAPPALNGGRQAMAPSVELNSVIGRDTILPREMTVEDIDRLVGLFVQAAVNSELAGADGVEIHGAHGYLLQQFMSPYTNKRTDEYGGSMENRCRFMVRILKGIREAVGPNFVVGARINGNDFVEGGNDQDACVEIAKYLEPYVDYFNVSCGVYASAATMIEPCYSPEGWRRPFVEAIKHAVKVPVIGVNALRHTEEAEKLLEEGVCDFVGMSRMHIADPYLVAKAKAGREDLIRKCLKCMNCNKSVVAGRNLHCAINIGVAQRGRARQADGRDIFAFELYGRLCHALGLYDLRVKLGEPGLHELVHLRPGGLRAYVHGVAQIVSNEVVDEAAGVFRVYDGVLAAAVGLRVAAEHDVWGVEAHIAELAVRSKVVHAVNADGGYPADRPGHGYGFEGVHALHLGKIAVQGVKMQHTQHSLNLYFQLNSCFDFRSAQPLRLSSSDISAGRKVLRSSVTP